MRYLPGHSKLLACEDSDAVFGYFIANLTESINLWSYFVNWDKVTNNVAGLEIDLLAMNYLVGKKDGEKSLAELLAERPKIALLLPILIACRQSSFSISAREADKILVQEKFHFGSKPHLSPKEIASAVRFARKSGLLAQFEQGLIKNVPDYVFGVEVGLDSNGRKNRGGTQMEDLVNDLLIPICAKTGAKMLKSATPAKIAATWGLRVKTDAADRIFDFAILKGSKLYLIETNYYNGGGTKLKATAGEFQTLSRLIKSQGIDFIWITDGLGWVADHRSMVDAFHTIDHVLNIKMIASGILEEILQGN